MVSQLLEDIEIPMCNAENPSYIPGAEQLNSFYEKPLFEQLSEACLEKCLIEEEAQEQSAA